MTKVAKKYILTKYALNRAWELWGRLQEIQDLLFLAEEIFLTQENTEEQENEFLERLEELKKNASPL